MKITFPITFILGLAILCTGCSSGPKIPSGQSAAEIAVKVEPKKGYHPPAAGSPGAPARPCSAAGARWGGWSRSSG